MHKGSFIVDQIFVLRTGFFKKDIVLAGWLIEGEMRIGDVIRLPSGRLLKIKSIEKKHEKTIMVTAREPCGVLVEGTGWKPSHKDIEEELRGRKYHEILGRFVEEVKKKYPGVSRDRLKQLVDAEIKARREEVDRLLKEASLDVLPGETSS